MRRYGRKPHNLFLDSSQGSEFPLLFSIREVASATMIAGDMQAMTDVSEMAQELMNSFVRGRDGDHGSWIMPTQRDLAPQDRAPSLAAFCSFVEIL